MVAEARWPDGNLRQRVVVTGRCQQQVKDVVAARGFDDVPTAKHDVLSDDAEENTPEETDDSNMQNVPVMQLRDLKHIHQPARYKDFVLTAEEMLNVFESDSFDEAIHNDQSNEWRKVMENEMQSVKDNQTW